MLPPSEPVEERRIRQAVGELLRPLDAEHLDRAGGSWTLDRFGWPRETRPMLAGFRRFVAASTFASWSSAAVTRASQDNGTLRTRP